MGTTQNNPAVAPAIFSAEEQHDRDNARRLAERYRVPFIDLREQRIDPELFRTIQADLMFRYNFVPIEQRDNVLVIADADPSLVLLSDELALLLGKKLAPRVATAKQIGDLLKRTEQSQRVLEQATEAFTLQVTKADEDTEETISGDRLTRDTTGSPVVKLVETVIFTALERRASDIHIEARDAAHIERLAFRGHLAHKSAERSGHCRTPRSARRAFSCPVQRSLYRFARFHHAGQPRRRRGSARPGQGNAFGKISELES